MSIGTKFKELQRKKTPIFFIKFTKKEFINDLKDGLVYMNSLQTFVEMEEENQEKGIGDKDELSLTINKGNIVATDLQSKRRIILDNRTQLKIQYESALKQPIYCLYTVSADMFEIINDYGTHIEIQLIFPKMEIEKIKEDMKDYNCAVFFPKLDFEQEIRMHFKELSCKALGGPVTYISGIEEKYVDDFFKGNFGVFLYKDEYFSYQREYRIVILDNKIVAPYRDFHSQVIKKSGIFFTTEALLNGECKLVYGNGEM